MLPRKILLLMVLLLIPAFANAEEPKNERHVYIAIYSGGTFFTTANQNEYGIASFASPNVSLAGWTDPIKFDNAFSVGFSIGYNLTSELDIEGSFQYTPTNERLSLYYPRPSDFISSADFFNPQSERISRVDVFSYSNNIIYYFFKKKVSPFLIGGLGGTTFRGKMRTVTNFSINVGGGLKFYLRKRVSLRLDLRDLIIFNEYIFNKTMNNFNAILGIEFHL